MSPIDERFALAVALMAGAAYGCRLVGYLIGRVAGQSPAVRRVLDALPASAMAAVIGPALVGADLLELAAAAVTAGVFLVSGRFLASLSAGAAVLVLAPGLIA